jgi:NAD(P)-dependent dehydrogenase (short-subunit alcohol dehydrogenase family)
VLVGSRDLARGEEAVAKLKADGLPNVEALQIDLDDESSITTAADTVAKTYGGTTPLPSIRFD